MERDGNREGEGKIWKENERVEEAKEERPEGRNVGEPWAISPGLESQGPRGGGEGPEARGGGGPSFSR